MQQRIKVYDGKEYDCVTGLPVFRDKKNRPYILEEDESEPLKEEDFAQLALAFYIRMVQDASGEMLYDNITTEEDRKEARDYLLNGKLITNGYYQYEHIDSKNKKKIYDSMYYFFICDNQEHSSNITMVDIARFLNTDYDLLADNIRKWQDSNWSRDHFVYKNAMKVDKFGV